MIASEGQSVTGARLYINCKPSSGTRALPISIFDGNYDNDLQNGGMLQLKELLKRTKQGKCLVENLRPDPHCETTNKTKTAGFFTYRVTKQFPRSQGFSGLFFQSCGGTQRHEELSMELEEALSSHEVTAALASAGLDVDIQIASSEEAEKEILRKHGVKAWCVVNSMQTGPIQPPIDTNEAMDVSLPTLLASGVQNYGKEGKCQWRERAAKDAPLVQRYKTGRLVLK